MLAGRGPKGSDLAVYHPTGEVVSLASGDKSSVLDALITLCIPANPGVLASLALCSFHRSSEGRRDGSCLATERIWYGGVSFI